MAIENITEVTSVADYLQEIADIIQNYPDFEDYTVVYRGEPRVYPIPCRANIFRGNFLSDNIRFERNLFDAMRQQGITKTEKYLHNAIDAQHGEFPSRLLDVTYNCMTALYFAVTGLYKKGDDCEDDNDGMVYLFFVDDIYSPSAKNTNEIYEAIINGDKEWFNNQILFEKNHKFIDHGKLNNRVIAQQGAFILFQGNDATPIPEYMIKSIKIPKEYKPKLRKELKQYFGIHTGSIYPELTNLVSEMTEKSKKIISDNFSFETEIKQVLTNLEKEIDFYDSQLFACFKNDKKEALKICNKIENIIKSYAESIGKYTAGSKDEIIKQYNDILDEKMKAYIRLGIIKENEKENRIIDLDLLKLI